MSSKRLPRWRTFVLASIGLLSLCLVVAISAGQTVRVSGDPISARPSVGTRTPGVESRAFANADADAPGTIEGTVELAGAPREGVDVTAMAIDPETPTSPTSLLHHTRSSTAGRFRFDNLRPGAYVAAATDGDLIAQPSSAIVLEPGGVVRGVALSLKPGAVVLSGRIDDGHGDPVARAAVTAINKLGLPELSTTTADLRGSYRLVVRPGEYSVVVHADGFSPREATLLVFSDKSFDIHLGAGAAVSGHVRLRDDGAPIAGAVVRLRSATSRVRHASPFEAITTSDGSFELHDIAPDRYQIVAFRGEWVGHHDGELVVEAGAVLHDLVVELDRGLSIAGHVQLDGGAAASTATVCLRGPGGGRWVHVDADGAYAIAGLAKGAYSVTAQAAGFAADKHDLRLDTADLESVDFRLSSGAQISGRVTTLQGHPVGDASVVAMGSGVVTARSDADGNFVLASLPPGRHRVLASDAKHGMTTLRTFVLSTGDHQQTTLVFENDSSVSGTVRWDDGEAAAGVVVEAVGATGRIEGITEADGQYVLTPLGAGIVNVRASRPGAKRSTMPDARPGTADVTLTAHERRTGIDVTLPRGGGSIRGIVIGPDGAPISGAAVSIIEESSSGVTVRRAALFGGADDTTQTARDGSFAFDDLARSRFSLFASAQGLAEAMASHVAANSGSVQLVLRPQASIAGRVVDAGGRPVSSFVIGVRSAGDHTGPPPDKVDDVSGAFVVNHLAPGTYDLVVMTSHGLGQIEGLRVAEGEHKTDLLISLRSTPSRTAASSRTSR